MGKPARRDFKLHISPKHSAIQITNTALMLLQAFIAAFAGTSPGKSAVTLNIDNL